MQSGVRFQYTALMNRTLYRRLNVSSCCTDKAFCVLGVDRVFIFKIGPRAYVALQLHDAESALRARRPPVRVLVADDSVVYQKLLLDCLGDWGFETVPVRDGSQAWALLQEDDAPKLALLDWVLPGMDGAELCNRLRQRENQPYVYTILLTAKERKDELIAGLEAGADDYLTKPFDPQELRVRLQTGFRLVRLQEELLAAQKALREQAAHDSLTGLWNRREIFDFLSREIARAKRQRHSIGVIMADVDFFKRVNDTLGHPAGDSVLVEVGRRMRLQLRSYDGIGRYGGEEFLMVLPDCEFDVVRERAEQLRKSVSATAVRTNRDPIRVTASLGVTACKNGEITPEALLEAADSALYRAKENGRNRVEACLERPSLRLQTI